MNILRWIEDQLAEHRRFKLELKRCPNCDHMADIIKNIQHEHDRLLTKFLESPTITSEPEVDMEDLKPVRSIPSRIQRAHKTHESFRKLNELKQEYEAQHEQ